MGKIKFFLFLSTFLFAAASVAPAQFPLVSAEEVKSWATGKKKAVIIDARLPDEYQAGHIAGAINIPAERMKVEASRLPKDKSTPLIFYCRGAG